ncbi:MAG: putative lipid II flippase FtsW [Pseudohongiellaceae bacterium]
MSSANAMTAPFNLGGSKSLKSEQLNPLLVVCLILLCVGLLMMTSASVEIASSKYGDSLFHFKRQIIFACVGLFGMLITMSIPLHLWKRFSPLLLAGTYFLLVLVLIPGIGKVVNGSARWIDLGPFDLQPSELAKVFSVLYIASFLERHIVEVQQNWSGFFKPMAIIATAVVLLHFEPDHGAMVILLLTAFCMIFLAGAKLYRFLLMLLMCVGAISYLAIMKPYVIARFSAFLDPWSAQNVYGSGYQLTQALIAFGRGEWVGVGLGNSIQKLYFLPEAHTDFVLAIVGEELGLIGVFFVIGLFCALVYYSFCIGRNALKQDLVFEGFFAYGLALLFAGQTIINVGVNISLLPTKGLTLPFVSYGGASLIVSCFMVALLMRIQYETAQAEVANSQRPRATKKV